MQPVFTQVPPKRLRSMIATFIPASDRRAARAGPAWPVPITIASNRAVITLPLSWVHYLYAYLSIPPIWLNCILFPVQFKSREKRRLGLLNVDPDCSRGMPCRLTNEHEIFCSLQANPCSRSFMCSAPTKTNLCKINGNLFLRQVASMLRPLLAFPLQALRF